MITESQMAELGPQYLERIELGSEVVEKEHKLKELEDTIVNTLREWPDLEDGDQERLLGWFKRKGVPISEKLRKDVQRTFDVAGVSFRGKKTVRTQRLKAEFKKTEKPKKGGKRATDQLLKVEKLVEDNKKRAARAVLRSAAERGPFKQLGRMVEDNPDIITSGDIDSWLKVFWVEWHREHDAEIARRLAEVAANGGK